jgi:hypothetical protein
MEQTGRRGEIVERFYEFSLISDLAPDDLGLPNRREPGYNAAQIAQAAKTIAYGLSVIGILGINIFQDIPNQLFFTVT